MCLSRQLLRRDETRDRLWTGESDNVLQMDAGTTWTLHYPFRQSVIKSEFKVVSMFPNIETRETVLQQSNHLDHYEFLNCGQGFAVNIVRYEAQRRNRIIYCPK